MAAVTVRGVTKQFGTQVVLDNVSLELHTGETVGLVGANGAGKTTLFRLIAGLCHPDLGTIAYAKGIEIGYLEQEPAIDLTRTLHEEVGSVFAGLLTLEGRLHILSEQIARCRDDSLLPQVMATYDRVNAQFIAAGGHTFEARLNEILGGLGFSKDDHLRPMSVLSGGQRCRAALAKLLLEDKPLLLLDEPTNHLDIDAVRWLEKFLTGHRGGTVIVSHDRYLLDRLCQRIVEVADHRLTSYPGNYTNFAQTKATRMLAQQRQFKQDRAFIAKEQAYVAKHLAGQRSRQAKGRRTRLQRRLDAGELVTEQARTPRTTRITFEKARTGEQTVLRCDSLCMAFGPDPLFTSLTFQVHAGDRFGITGPNGTGKTTLLRIVLGEIAPTGGTYELSSKLKVGYYAQEAAKVDPDRTILAEIRAARPQFSEEEGRTFLGRFLFTKDDAFKTLGMLSGGEQSRVRLATLILTTPDVLVLDEPTNHLDIPSREALEEALTDFTGTIIAVSHDRYFLDRVVERLLIIRPEGHRICPGNYSYYIAQLEQQQAAARTKGRAPQRKARPPEPRLAKSTPSPFDRLSIEELEAMVVEREVELAALQQRFGDPAVCKDPDALAELQEEVEAVTRELEAVDAAWQERVDAQ